MKDGNVQVKVKDNQIVKVEVGTGLDGTYARLFEAACGEARSGSPSIDVGVKVVIFGCFWLEAVCNCYLRDLLKTSLPAAADKSWNKLKGAKTSEKLLVIASFHSANSDHELIGARRVFRLRNQLAHFKESYKEVPGPHSLDDDLDEWKESLPETTLVTQLKQPEIESSIEDIVRTNAWLDRVHESIFKRVRHKIDPR